MTKRSKNAKPNRRTRRANARQDVSAGPPEDLAAEAAETADAAEVGGQPCPEDKGVPGAAPTPGRAADGLAAPAPPAEGETPAQDETGKETQGETQGETQDEIRDETDTAPHPGGAGPRAFVVGHPIGHSRSPLIHRHWLEKHGIAGTYEPIDIEPADLAGFIDRLRAGEFAGGNVTIPHKQEVRALCDRVTPVAEQIGAVNTLYMKDGVLVGTNTDHSGFLGNLDESAPGWDRGLGVAIVLGAGGAARGIIHALKARNVGRIHLLNRTVSKAEELAELFGDVVAPGPLDAFDDLAPGAGLVVNTTSIGLGGTSFEGIDMAQLPQSAIVTDAVYTPLLTPFLAAARDRMLKTVDGLGMLLHQAVPGFESWFGVTPTVTPELRSLIVADLEAETGPDREDAPPSGAGG